MIIPKMYRSYKKPVTKAFPNIRIPEPRISRFVVFLSRLFGRLYLFLFYGVARIVLREEKHLFNAFKRALAGESRLIVAFRHPNGGEPQTLAWFFLFRLRLLAALKGIRFKRWPHAVPVYSYEVVRWGGWVVRFVMPNLGALPIHHAKVDRNGMERIYKTIIDGPYPMSLAPEGQVSYTADSVPRLEPGAIRIGFNAAQRIAAKGMDCPVEILPVSVHFRFGAWGRGNIELLLRIIEKRSGFSGKRHRKLPFTERLRHCRDHILEVNESRYKIAGDASLPFEERLERVIYSALETAERMLGIRSEGELFSRMNLVRQLCWDRIFLPEAESLGSMTYIERNMMDLRAGEAWYIARHLELVDFCWYFRVPLPAEDAALHNKIEYVQNLWDFANRTMGGAYSNRMSVFPRKVIIHSAPIINLSERLPSYEKDKKATVAQAMADLEKAYIDCINDANSAEPERR